MKRSKADLVRGWLEKARRDFGTAKRELTRNDPFTDIVCFHAQQAAEKYLKAYLTWRGIDFPRTHALEDLVLLAGGTESVFLTLMDQAASLTPYAVETRYPEFEEPLYADAREAVKVAAGIRRCVLRHLPDDLRPSSGKGPRSEPAAENP